jgi:hypothetical protein
MKSSIEKAKIIFASAILLATCLGTAACGVTGPVDASTGTTTITSDTEYLDQTTTTTARDNSSSDLPRVPEGCEPVTLNELLLADEETVNFRSGESEVIITNISGPKGVSVFVDGIEELKGSEKALEGGSLAILAINSADERESTFLGVVAQGQDDVFTVIEIGYECFD